MNAPRTVGLAIIFLLMGVPLVGLSLLLVLDMLGRPYGVLVASGMLAFLAILFQTMFMVREGKWWPWPRPPAGFMSGLKRKAMGPPPAARIIDALGDSIVPMPAYRLGAATRLGSWPLHRALERLEARGVVASAWETGHNADERHKMGLARRRMYRLARSQ